ncbi:hypothetical protein CLIB1444_12S02102 [[Candida] jaroonii]|uniref:Uncharacterized protein n=1 Tax=[Candida] jaroonii TaxID=467808 RepID=A0ACA9YDE5_9ASCO|nr:hypothetical protein CLIB1444_12S02102 [[Candida] jaroonii]
MGIVKRTKPCSNCKRSKVKCTYIDSLPCERCVKQKQAHLCVFVPKLPSLKFQDPLPPYSQINESSTVPPVNTPKPNNIGNLTSKTSVPPTIPSVTPSIPSVPPSIPSVASTLPQSSQIPSIQNITRQSTPQIPFGLSQYAHNEGGWKNEMSSKMNLFDNRLNDLMDVFTKSQKELLQQQERHYQEIMQQNSANQNALKRQISNDSEQNDEKRRKFDVSEDFRDNLLTLNEAKSLFQFFDSNITPQLFGFEISKISIDEIWKSSPILICAICTISSIHHPNFELSTKSKDLMACLHKLCSDLLFQRPTTEIDGFNTILALIFCSFWLSDSQMFTGLALQIAKEIGLDQPKRNKSDKSLNSRDRLKLWYLLYVLDGQQSLTYNRQPLLNAGDYSIQHSRSLLLSREQGSIEGVNEIKEEVKPETKEEEYSRFTDMRLVSQVEYNQALNEVFKGNAWELLAPSSLGIPSKSNLELDKWMVSWTVLLSPMNQGAVWPSKSTLIYYNFAKMHINSQAVRQLQSDNQNSFPKLQELPDDFGPQPAVVELEESDNWEDDSDDEEEFISQKQLIGKGGMLDDAAIAFNAAQTVLNLVLIDKDIVNNLKYVPVHIHIMLYYAALLLVGNNNVETTGTMDHFTNLITNLSTVCSLRKLISENKPVDKTFGRKLLTSLDDLIEEKMSTIKKSILEADIEDKNELLHKLSTLSEQSSKIFETRSESPPIYAWPGANHGHPSQPDPENI